MFQSYVWMTPDLAVLAAGMVAAVVHRRRYPAVARRVFAGCAGLAVGRVGPLAVMWLRRAVDPAPVFGLGYAPRWTFWGIFDGLQYATLAVFITVQAVALLVLVSAVVSRPESGRARGGADDAA